MMASEKITYLDNNATTAIDPAVLEAMRPYLEKYFANPSSGYRFGMQARRAVDRARERMAAMIDCEPGPVTSRTSTIRVRFAESSTSPRLGSR